MTLNKARLSNVFFIIALIVLVGGAADLIFSFKDFILSGKGIGVYGVLIYIAKAIFSVVLWGFSYFFNKNNRLAVLYWALFITLTGFILVQPTWWSVP